MFGDIGISDPALDSGAAQMIYIHYDEDHRVKNVVNDAGSTLCAYEEDGQRAAKSDPSAITAGLAMCSLSTDLRGSRHMVTEPATRTENPHDAATCRRTVNSCILPVLEVGVEPMTMT
jgi:hypothetical protein